MGYTFEVHSASLSLSGLSASSVSAGLSVEVLQSGVAPFYYPLYATLYGGDGGVLGTGDLDLSQLLPKDKATVSFNLGLIELEALGEPWELRLESGILQPEQRVRIATSSPSTNDSTGLRLDWAVGCVTSNGLAPLGTALGVDASGCPCRCDVDGAWRSCDGALCEEL